MNVAQVVAWRVQRIGQAAAERRLMYHVDKAEFGRLVIHIQVEFETWLAVVYFPVSELGSTQYLAEDVDGTTAGTACGLEQVGCLFSCRCHALLLDKLDLVLV